MTSQDTAYDPIAGLDAAIDAWRVAHRHAPEDIAALLLPDGVANRLLEQVRLNAHFLGLGRGPFVWENGRVRFTNKGESLHTVQTYKGIPVLMYTPPIETSAVFGIALDPRVLVYPSIAVRNAQEAAKQPNLTALGAKRMDDTSSLENGTSASVMVQQAPYPSTLKYLVSVLRYKPGWTFTLRDIDRGQGSKGLTLCILISSPDTNDPSVQTRVMHYMLVPPAAYNRESWTRWLFTQIWLVEKHEAAEFFRIEGRQPYAPNHGPGWDPYQVRELNTQEAAETTFRGEHKAMPSQ